MTGKGEDAGVDYQDQRERQPDVEDQGLEGEAFQRSSQTRHLSASEVEAISEVCSAGELIARNKPATNDLRAVDIAKQVTVAREGRQ